VTEPGAAIPVGGELADSARADFWRRFRRSRNARVGGALVVLVGVAALAAPWLAPYGYEDTDLLAVWAEPSRAHLLGGDALGRDVLSRLIVGARVSLLVAASVLALTLTLGTLAGMVAGYFGGWADALLMRSADIVFAFPELILAIVVAAMLGPRTWTVIVALAIVWWDDSRRAGGAPHGATPRPVGERRARRHHRRLQPPGRRAPRSPGPSGARPVSARSPGSDR
jgi:ABC-type dipeptide/oligopeptide/nickel transport system permease subunit